MPNYVNLENQQYSYLGKGSFIEGQLVLFGTTHLGSKVNGNIEMKDLADITIELSGSLIGTIKCHNLEIFGSLEGEISASGKVTIHPSATITGQIKAMDLIIHPGSCVNFEAHTLED